MSGTTLCSHCGTRFKIAKAQLDSHRGMVRCGQCLQPFDARASFIPEEPDPQLELPILDEPPIKTTEDNKLRERPTDNTLDFNQPATRPVDPEYKTPFDTPLLTHNTAAHLLTLAEQVVIVQDENNDEAQLQPEYRRWPWISASALLALVLLGQTAYFFRVDLGARLPGLKPALIGYCQLLGCNVPLPQKADLMGIESSELEAVSEHENQIILNALLRNRAPYSQAFPNLELTLNDTQDKPLARRIFKPENYLPPVENEKTGISPNHELAIKLRLNIADLRPTGYRLALHYPRQ
jgi:predicted Zn finger-like uncharacterized protein